MNMKISLVFPPFYLEPMYNLPPVGLVHLATMIARPGRQVAIHDFVLAIRTKSLKMGRSIYDDCAQMIMDEDPDVIGFSAQCTTYPAVIQIGERVKALKRDAKILVGGHNASFVDGETLSRFPWIDAVIRGEGEMTFQQLIGAYEAGHDETDIAGLTYRRGSEIFYNGESELIPNLDELPLADYSYVPALSAYRDACGLPRSIAILEVGRGCPHRCVYCSESRMWRRQSRTFSVARLVREMRHLHETYGAECFLLAYDQFTANRTFVEDFCRSVMTAGLNHLPWYCISRLDTVDSALLSLMREAGCESMCYGIDSGSKKTLAFIRKHIDEGILYQRVRETTDQGIVPTLSFVVGFPEEEKEDIDETLLLALKTGIQGNSNPLIQMPTVLPGTELYERFHKRLLRGVDTYFSLGLEFDEGHRLPSDEHLIDSDPSLFSSFYNIPCKGVSLSALHLMSSYFPLIVNLYPRSFLLLSLALRQSVGDLFLMCLECIQERAGRDQPFLTAPDCYEYFSSFAEGLPGEAHVAGWSHLRDVIRYETAALEAGKFSHDERPGNIDLCQLRGWKPLRRRNVRVQEFERNLPMIIEDLKAGIFKEDYPMERTWLVFHHEADQLEVTEINDFGKDFLNMCDGSATVEEIAGALFQQYGQDMDSGVFVEACREALVGLSGLRLLRETRSDRV